jgi:hypothetical protein
VGLAGFLDEAAEPGQARFPCVLRRQLAQLVVKDIELHPHLGRDQRPQRPGVLARHVHGGEDRFGIGLFQDIEPDDRLGGGGVVMLEKTLAVVVEQQYRHPVLAAGAVPAEGLVDVQDARQVLGPLDVAGHPERRLGVAGKQITQGPRYPSSRRPATS